jgi:hypothetical protein
MPAVVGRHARADAENPWREPRAALEVGQALLDDEEHVVAHIVEVRLAYAHALQRKPDEARPVGVDEVQTRRLERGVRR